MDKLFVPLAPVIINVFCTPVRPIRFERLDEAINILNKQYSILELADLGDCASEGLEAPEVNEQHGILLLHYSREHVDSSVVNTAAYEPNRQAQLILGIIDIAEIGDELDEDLSTALSQFRDQAIQSGYKQDICHLLLLDTQADAKPKLVSLQTTTHKSDDGFGELLVRAALSALRTQITSIESLDRGLPTTKLVNSMPNQINTIQDLIESQRLPPDSPLQDSADREQSDVSSRTSHHQLISTGLLLLQSGLYRRASAMLLEGLQTARALHSVAWHAKAFEGLLDCLLVQTWAGIDFNILSVDIFADDDSNNSDKWSVVPGLKLFGTNRPSIQKITRATLSDFAPNMIGTILDLYRQAMNDNSERLPAVLVYEAYIRLTRISVTTRTAGRLQSDLNCSRILERSVGRKAEPNSRKQASLHTFYRNATWRMLGDIFEAIQRDFTPYQALPFYKALCETLSELGMCRKQAFQLRELVQRLLGILNSVQKTDFRIGDSSIKQSIWKSVNDILQLLCTAYGVPFDFVVLPNQPDQNQSCSSINPTLTLGDPVMKLEILQLCVQVSTAVTDMKASLKFTSLLMSCISTSATHKLSMSDMSVYVEAAEQARMLRDIERVVRSEPAHSGSGLQATFWDRFLVRGISLNDNKTPEKSQKSTQGAMNSSTQISRASIDQDDPLLHNPFSITTKSSSRPTTSRGTSVSLNILLQNWLSVEVEIESISLLTEGCEFSADMHSIVLGPSCMQTFQLRGTAMSTGVLKIKGCYAQIKCCKPQDFAIFPEVKSLAPDIKQHGRQIIDTGSEFIQDQNINPFVLEIEVVEVQESMRPRIPQPKNILDAATEAGLTVELSNVLALPDRAGSETSQCLLQFEVHNLMPFQAHLIIDIHAENDKVDGTDPRHSEFPPIQPHSNDRVFLILDKIYIANSHNLAPSSPTADSQVFRSTQTIEPSQNHMLDRDLTAGEAYWYRKALLSRLKMSWKEQEGQRSGLIDLSDSMSLTPRMIEVMRADDIDVRFSVSLPAHDGSVPDFSVKSSMNKRGEWEIQRHELNTLTTHVHNRSLDCAVKLLLRLYPTIRDQKGAAMTDLSGKLLCSGNLQSVLPGGPLKAKEQRSTQIDIVGLATGLYEFRGSVEEVRAGVRSKHSDNSAVKVAGSSKRRIWFAKPCLVRVVDNP